jgi:hypothetical protein
MVTGCTLDRPARDAVLQPRQALVGNVEGVEPAGGAHQRAQQQRLAAGAGAEIATISPRFGASR